MHRAQLAEKIPGNIPRANFIYGHQLKMDCLERGCQANRCHARERAAAPASVRVESQPDVDFHVAVAPEPALYMEQPLDSCSKVLER